MKKWTLQVQITAITGLILLAACLLLTANALFSADSYYGDYASLIRSEQVTLDPSLPENIEIDPAVYAADEFYQTASQKFSTQSLLVMVLIIIVALGATYWATGRMLRSLRALTQSVCTVDDTHLHQRVPLPNTHGEVLVLTEAFNHMLERLEESFLMQKGFAANAAHELKTPLAAIKSSLQVMEMNPQPKSEDYQEFMQDTNQSLERIIQTVNGLLALANMNIYPVNEPVQLYLLLQEVEHELSSIASANHVTLVIAGTKDITVLGNPDLLYRAFYNLMENAIKYNRPEGQVAVMVEQEHGAIHVSVRDTGIGMQIDAVRHIFEPFYRADLSRSQTIPGSGLGLAVVKMILERHGADIQVKTEVGTGSTFIVTFWAQS